MAEIGCDEEAAVRSLRHYVQRPDVRGGHGLQPDRLPDSGCACVVAAGVPVPGRLLAAGLRLRGGVARTHDDGHLVTCYRDPGERCRERTEPAAMARHLDVIDPDSGVVVDGPEVQEHIAPHPVLRDPDDPPVPDSVQEVGVLDFRRARLRCKRDQDPAAEVTGAQPAIDPGIAAVDFELPIPVEGEPVRADELRSRVFRLRNGCRQGAAFLCCGGAHPFTAPLVMPATICRLKKM